MPCHLLTLLLMAQLFKKLDTLAEAELSAQLTSLSLSLLGLWEEEFIILSQNHWI